MVRLTDRHKMTYSKNTKIHILIIHTKQEKYQSGVRFFSEQLRVFRGAGPPDCPNGAFVYRKILNTYYDIYLFVSLIVFIYACAYLQFCRHAHAYVFLFCFVIPSSILPIPCYFLSAATCINLPSNYCHYFYFFFPNTRMCAPALMQTRTCVSVFFFSLAPILPTSAYVVFIFPRGRVLHTRICVSAFVPLRICVCFLISFR